MTDTVQPPAPPGPSSPQAGGGDHGEGTVVRRAASRARTSRGGKRRAKPRRRHTVGRVLAVTVVVLAMVSGLSVAYLYRHLNGNITELALDDQLGERPDKVVVEGPQEPLNILVMGSDSRDGAGNNIDGLTGDGERSDTTILIHLSADRSRAYGVSIPRDSMVDRPECTDDDGGAIPAASYEQWNAAFAIGGPACTIRQVEATTGLRVDHYVVVDFAGFKDMVDAIGGVEVCIPDDWDDREHGIYLRAGTRKISGDEALSYVRIRHVPGSDGTDLGRVKRQQAFIGSMAAQVLSSGTLANPLKIVRFLEAATKSLQVDPGLANLTDLGQLAYQFRDIGLDKIQFLTVPWMWDPDDPNRVVWAPEANQLWNRLKHDKPLSQALSRDAIAADAVPGATESPAASGTPSSTPSGQPSAGASAGASAPSSPVSPTAPLDTEELEAAGLCA